MTRTVTYDETQWKLVPTTISILQTCPIKDELIRYSEVCRSGASELFADTWSNLIAAAPPYPDQSVEVNDMVWIPCSERLPEMNVPVLTFDGHSVNARCRINLGPDNGWGWGIPQNSNLSDYINYESDDDVLFYFWMSLPPAPKEPE